MTSPHPPPFAFPPDLQRPRLKRLPEHLLADPLDADRAGWLRYRIQLLEHDLAAARPVDARAAKTLDRLLQEARAELQAMEEEELRLSMMSIPNDVLEAIAWRLAEAEGDNHV
ncbi:MAG: hypothetical protein H6716_24730 [Polyangiaceae bacterium]|nr:hypothetical protein [Polyangiaceae bacterium]